MSKPNQRNGYIQQQGQMFEDTAVKTIGGDAKNLNEEAAEGKIGHQYPTFDVSSSTEIASVKSHITEPGKITDQDIAAYKSDFSKMLGWDRAYDRGLSPMEQDAERIENLPDSQPVPAELKGADRGKIVDYLEHRTVMRIPDDHVEAVRQGIKADIDKGLQGNYFLPDNPSEEQIQSVLNRVQGAGLTTTECAERMQSQNAIAEGQAETGEVAEQEAGAQMNQQEAQAEPSGPEKDVQEPETGKDESKSEDEEYDYGIGF